MRARDHDEPIIRPTFFTFPDDETCLADSDDFMLGDDLLVAPVVARGATVRRVYLPRAPGGWIDFANELPYRGGETIEVAAPLARLPLFVRSGARLWVADPPGPVPTHDDPVRTVSFGAPR